MLLLSLLCLSVLTFPCIWHSVFFIVKPSVSLDTFSSFSSLVSPLHSRSSPYPCSPHQHFYSIPPILIFILRLFSSPSRSFFYFFPSSFSPLLFSRISVSYFCISPLSYFCCRIHLSFSILLTPFSLSISLSPSARERAYTQTYTQKTVGNTHTNSYTYMHI